MIMNFIIAMLFVIILIAARIMIDNKREKIFICIVCFIGYVLCICNNTLNIPAIEVYRGNTSLEVTYKDNIPIDSVVVWKK